MSNTSANPFSNNTAVQSYLSNVHASSIPSKMKKDSQLPLSSFHQRTKPKKAHGRVTPSISGRLTPSVSNANKITVRQFSSDKPIGSAPSNNLPGETTSEPIKTENQLPFVSSVAVPILPNISKTQQTELTINNDKNKKLVYNIPHLSNLNPPILPCNLLDPMYAEREENMKGVETASSIKAEPMESSRTLPVDGFMQLDPVPIQR